MEISQCIVCFVTCANRQEAEKIIDALLSEKLIACANIIDNVQSVYFWQGKKENQMESLIVSKSRKELFGGIISTVKANHSYEVPEIISFDITGDSDYLAWIDNETRK